MKREDNTNSLELLREEVEQHLDHCPDCSKKVQAIDEMLGSLSTYRDVFHPPLERLYEFAQTGEDPAGKFALHLNQCETCRQEVESFKACAAETEMSEEVRSIFRFHLSKTAPDRPGSEGLFARFRECISSLFRIPVVQWAAVAAVAALLVIAVYLLVNLALLHGVD